MKWYMRSLDHYSCIHVIHVCYFSRAEFKKYEKMVKVSYCTGHNLSSFIQKLVLNFLLCSESAHCLGTTGGYFLTSFLSVMITIYTNVTQNSKVTKPEKQWWVFTKDLFTPKTSVYLVNTIVSLPMGMRAKTMKIRLCWIIL